MVFVPDQSMRLLREALAMTLYKLAFRSSWQNALLYRHCGERSNPWFRNVIARNEQTTLILNVIARKEAISILRNEILVCMVFVSDQSMRLLRRALAMTLYKLALRGTWQNAL